MGTVFLLGVGLASGLGACIVVDSMLAVSCVEHVTEDVAFATPNADAALQFKLDRCKVDHDACGELCMLALQRSGIGNAVSACRVDFGVDQAVVHVTFDHSTGARGCDPQSGSGINFDAGGMPIPLSDL